MMAAEVPPHAGTAGLSEEQPTNSSLSTPAFVSSVPNSQNVNASPPLPRGLLPPLPEGTTRERRRPREQHVTPTLSPAALLTFARSIQCDERVRITYAGADGSATTENGTVTAVSTGRAASFTVQFDLRDLSDSDDSDNDVAARTLTFPSEDYDLIEAFSLRKLPGLPCLHESTRMLFDLPDWVIYKDGSGSQSADATGSAIVIKHMRTKRCFVVGTHHPQSTNNVAEYAADVAALTVAQILKGSVAILGDSQLVHRQVTGKANCNTPHLRPFCKKSCDLWTALDRSRVSLHHIDGHGDVPNLADAPAKLAKCLQRPISFFAGVDDGKFDDACTAEAAQNTTSHFLVGATRVELPSPTDLFPPMCTVARKAPKKPVQPLPPEVIAANAAADATPSLRINTLDDFLALRALPARNDVPRQVRAQWAQVQKRAVNAVALATDLDERNQAMLDLMTLPNRWLPRSCSTRRITQHFLLDKPFDMTPPKEKARTVKSSARRLAEMVERKAKNRDLRGAVQLLQSSADCDAPQPTEDERFAALQSKFHSSLKGELLRDIKDEDIPQVPPVVIVKVIRSMKRTAASCIDGWCKSLLQYATIDDPSLIDGWATITTQILRGQFGPTVMNCLRASRVVGVPKPDGGTRPISVSNFFLKLAGAAALRMDGASCKPWQYAIGRKDGTRAIVHQLREHKRKGHTIFKMDQKNAYGEMPKRLVEMMLSNTHNRYLKAYFRNVCYCPRTLAVYGESRLRKMIMGDGFGQGDATSSFLFCLGLDHILQNIHDDATAAGVLIEAVYAYMDDVTWVTKNAADAHVVAQIAERRFAEWAMKINMQSEKSACMIPDGDPAWNEPTGSVVESLRMMQFNVQRTSEQFVVVGADISDDPRDFLVKYSERQDRFFQLLRGIDMHPALLFTILRFCGNPRLRYICQVMPPCKHLQALCARFDTAVYRTMNSPTLLKGRLLSPEILYDQSTTAFTQYFKEFAELYENSKRSVLRDRTGPLDAVAAAVAGSGARDQPSNSSVPSLATDIGNQWMFLDSEKNLSPAEFTTALSARFGLLPEPVKLPCKCNCGKLICSEVDFIEHAYRCDVFTSFTKGMRHDQVMYQALVETTRAYGIHCVVEPRKYVYGDAKKNRPDIFWRLSPPLAIDLTIVAPDAVVGAAAAHAAAEKIDKHHAAVAAFGDVFKPFVIELQGHLHEDADDTINRLAKELLPLQRAAFRRDIKHAIAVELARAKAKQVLSAVAKQFALEWMQ